MRRVAAIAGALALALALILALAACSSSSGETTFTVTHGPVKPLAVTPGPGGGAIGTVRIFHADTAPQGGGTGYLDGTMTTTGSDVSQAGVEIRVTELVFTSDAWQLILEGTALYPSAGSTIDVGKTAIRPIIGGSGRYAGARGWAESTQNADGTWTHVFHLLP